MIHRRAERALWLALAGLLPGRLPAQTSRPAPYRAPAQLSAEDEPLRRAEQVARDAARAKAATALRAVVQTSLALPPAQRSAADRARLRQVAEWSQRVGADPLARLLWKSVRESEGTQGAEDPVEFDAWPEAGARGAGQAPPPETPFLRQSLALKRRITALRAELAWLLREMRAQLLPPPAGAATGELVAFDQALRRLNVDAVVWSVVWPADGSVAPGLVFRDADPWPRQAAEALTLMERACRERGGNTAALGPPLIAYARALRGMPRALAEARHREAAQRKGVPLGQVALCAVDLALACAGDGEDAQAVTHLERALQQLTGTPEAAAALPGLTLTLAELKLRRGDRKGAAAALQSVLRGEPYAKLQPSVQARLLIALASDGQAPRARALVRDELKRSAAAVKPLEWALWLLPPDPGEWGLPEETAPLAQLLGLSTTPADEADALACLLEERSRHYRAMRVREWVRHAAAPDPELMALLGTARERRRQLLLATLANDAAALKEHSQHFTFEDDLLKRVEAAPEPRILATARSLEQLSASLPEHGVALVTAQAAPADGGEARQRVFLLHRGGTQGFDLGPRTGVAAAVAEWRAALRQSLPAASPPGPAALATLLQPVLAALPADTTTVLVLPEGPLAGVPWEAVPGETGDRDGGRQVRYLLCLDALERRPPPTGSMALLAIGGVDYALPAAQDAGGREPPLPVPVSDGFAAMPAAAAEATECVAVFKRFHPKVNSWLFTGVHATRSASIAAMSEVRFMHLGTHAFHTGAMPWSGLVLAGAGNPDPAVRARGVLLAGQLQQLDLHGCELVVLPTTDATSGSDDHLLRLVRALHCAGVRHVLMSLWPVPDAARARFLSVFYQRLWDGKRTVAEALAEARGTVRKDGLGPGVWAAFVHFENG